MEAEVNWRMLVRVAMTKNCEELRTLHHKGSVQKMAQFLISSKINFHNFLRLSQIGIVLDSSRCVQVKFQ